MSKIFLNSLQIVIQQIEKYLLDKQEVEQLLFSLDEIIDQIPDDDKKKKCVHQWGQIEIISSICLDEDRDLTEDEQKRICTALINLRDVFVGEVSKHYILPQASVISKKEFLQECNSLMHKSRIQSMEYQDFVECMAELLKKNQEEYPGKSKITDTWVKLYNRSLDEPNTYLPYLELEELAQTLEHITYSAND